MAAQIPTKVEPSKTREFSGIFTAIVESSDPISFACVVCPVNVSGLVQPRMQGIPLSHCMANLFGFKDNQLHEPGSSVLCYYIDPFNAFIIGAIPTNDQGFTGSFVPLYPSRNATGQGDALVDAANFQGYGTDLSKNVFHNLRRATDTVQGEHVYANDFGVLLGLFQQMAVLKGSELAQVQTHLLDDMVRIISHNYQHWTSSGELKIYHDGKALITEYGGTHIPEETYGNPIRTTDVATTPFTDTGTSKPNDLPDYFTLTGNERAQAIERFKVYVGRLGDFINAFMAVPATTSLPDLAGTQPQNPDLGAFNFHLGTDGGTHVRSIKEIFLEKVNWIRVPQRILDPEDPTGDNANNIVYPPKQEFKFDNSFKVQDNPFLYYLQLRDYVAYTTQVNNYLNLSQHKKDFYLNSDLTKETNIASIGNVDPQTPAKNQGNYALRTSGIYLMDNGGFMLRDAWGSAIVSEGGNIYIQPARSLYLQPLANLVGKVGQFVSIAANNDIDFSSTQGGLRYKSDLAQYFYSDNSGLVFQANGLTPSTGTPDPTKDAVETVGGIVFKSALGIYNYATTDILQYATNNLVLKSDNYLYVQGQQTFLSSENTISIAAQSNVGVYSLGAIEIAASTACTVGGAQSTAFGQKDNLLGFEYEPITQNPYIDPLKGVLNIPDMLGGASTIITTNALSTVDVFQTKQEFQKLNFRFLSTDKYDSELSYTSDPIPQTIAQQQDLQINSGVYSPWKETPVNSSYPYPGAELFDSLYAASTGLNNFQKYPDSQDLAEADAPVVQPTAIKPKSLNTYPVLTLT